MNLRILAFTAVTALTLTFAGCAKHTPVAKTTPPTPAPAPTATAPASTPAPARNYSQPSQVAQTPAPRMPDGTTRARIQDLLNRIQDAYFDYNQHTLRPDAEVALRTDAQTLADI